MQFAKAPIKNYYIFLLSAMFPFPLSSLAADVNGTPDNDLLYYQGSVEQLTTNIVNPYSGEIISINDYFNVNLVSYDGFEGFDTLLMSNGADALFLEDVNGVQMLANMERILAGALGDIVHLASNTYLLGDLVISGGAGDDILWSNIGNDAINGLSGNDVIDGGPGNDTINGGNDDDTINGGSGNDSIDGGPGQDIVNGGAGDDLIRSSFDLDSIDGGPGEDTYDLGSASGVTLNDWSVELSGNPEYEFDIYYLGTGTKEAELRNVEKILFNDVELDLTALLSAKFNCQGFFSPFETPKTISKKAKGTIPVKIILKDKYSQNIGNNELISPPVINVTFDGVTYGNGSTDDDALESVGSANDGNEFTFNTAEQVWQYNLSTKQFSSAGTYTVTVRSGDEGEYTIDTSNDSICTQTFTRKE